MGRFPPVASLLPALGQTSCKRKAHNSLSISNMATTNAGSHKRIFSLFVCGAVRTQFLIGYARVAGGE